MFFNEISSCIIYVQFVYIVKAKYQIAPSKAVVIVGLNIFISQIDTYKYNN